MSVIDARLKVVDYTQNNLRFHSKNAQEPQIKTQEGSKTYTWQLSNAKPIEYESYNTVTADYFTTVFLAPKRFEMDGYAGDLSDWKSFGSWINTLNSSRNNLSEVHEANIYSLKLKKKAQQKQSKAYTATFSKRHDTSAFRLESEVINLLKQLRYMRKNMETVRVYLFTPNRY